MALDVLWVALGLGLLLLAGDVLVRGAVNLSLRLGIPALMVGLTVVAFGTSAPELLVSVEAVWAGLPGLALGNVVGSNTANILMVLGVPALISAMAIGHDVARSYLIMLAVSAVFILLAFVGPLHWPHALLLLAGGVWMLHDNYARARDHRKDASAPVAVNAEDLEGADLSMPWPRIIIYLVLGVIGLPLGANLLVDGAGGIARTLGVSDAVIGLTLVALGTSLPELSTTVMAALRREAGVALGNVIGSNMFNLLFIIGIAALVGAIPVEPEMLRFDLWVMFAASLLIGPFILMRTPINRVWGAVLTALYLGYLVAVFTLGAAV